MSIINIINPNADNTPRGGFKFKSMGILNTLGNGLSSGMQTAGSKGFGLGSLIKGAINNLFAKKAEQRQLRNNMKLMDYQNKLNQENEFSSYGRQIAGMKAAGINPALADGSAPQSVSGSSVSQGSGQADEPDVNPKVSTETAAIEKDIEVKDSQKNANEALAREHNANAESQEIENENARNRWQNKDTILGYEAQNSATSAKYFEEMTREQLRALGANADVSKWEAKCKEIDSWTRGQFNQATIDNIVANTGMQEAHAKQLLTAARLNGVLMSYYGEETRAKRYINDLNDYFNSFGYDANPVAQQEFEKLRKLVTDIDNAGKSGNYTDAVTAGQTFANEVAPADKAFQWGNMILNTLMTGVMAYSILRGAGANPMSGVGKGSQVMSKTPWQTSQIESLKKAARHNNINSNMVWTQEMKNVAFDAARQRGWSYNAKSRRWVKYDSKQKKWLQTDETSLLNNYMKALGY